MIASTEAKIGRSMKKEEMFIASYFAAAAGAGVRQRQASAPIVTFCGVTVMPGCTRCAPFTTMTSPALRPSRTMRKPSITRPELHLAILDLCCWRPSTSTYFWL